ncbi:MAG TPA: hypothetical protein VF187_04960, partial [Gemmatimonadales bacterium]
VIAVMRRNVVQARELLRRVVPRLRDRPVSCPLRCDRALDSAIVTAEAARDPAAVERLRAVAGRVL